MKSSATHTDRKTEADPSVTSGLNQVVADTYALLAITHDAHWNVEGPSFFQLHKAFEEQYEELFEAVDVVAERARALDTHVPGGLHHFAEASGIEEFHGPCAANDYVAGLIVVLPPFRGAAAGPRSAAVRLPQSAAGLERGRTSASGSPHGV
jgi:starvation-inducible DNA-binding protein